MALTIPNTFVSGTSALAAQVNANFTAVASHVNGQLDQTSFTNITGAITWAVVSNVLAQNIASSSTAGVITISATGVLAAAKSVIAITSAANQTTGDAGLYINFSSASSTIPVAKFQQAGTGKVLQVVSTTAPSVPAPVMTTAQKANITGAAGDQVFDSTLKRSEFHDGVAWRGQGAIKSVLSKSADYTVTGNDDIILCDTTVAFTLTLPAAASHKGKSLIIKKFSNDFNALTVATNSTETIDGVDGSALHTRYEQLEIVSDGSNWHVVERNIPSVWESFTPTGSATSLVTYTGYRRRVGDSWQFRVKIAFGGVNSDGEVRISIPNSQTIDTSKILDATTENGTLGDATILDNGTTNFKGHVRYHNNTAVTVCTQSTGSTYNFQGSMNTASNVPMTIANGDYVVAHFEVPISGWNA